MLSFLTPVGIQQMIFKLRTGNSYHMLLFYSFNAELYMCSQCSLLFTDTKIYLMWGD